MNAYPIFDQRKFGALIRRWRRQEGYSNTELFSEAIEEKTGVYIDKDTLVRIERGERLPDVGKYFALILTLSGDCWRNDSVQVMEESLRGRAALIELEDKLEWIRASVSGFCDALGVMEKSDRSDYMIDSAVFDPLCEDCRERIEEASLFALSAECDNEEDEATRIRLLALIDKERKTLNATYEKILKLLNADPAQ